MAPNEDLTKPRKVQPPKRFSLKKTVEKPGPANTSDAMAPNADLTKPKPPKRFSLKKTVQKPGPANTSDAMAPNADLTKPKPPKRFSLKKTVQKPGPANTSDAMAPNADLTKPRKVQPPKRISPKKTVQKPGPANTRKVLPPPAVKETTTTVTTNKPKVVVNNKEVPSKQPVVSNKAGVASAGKTRRSARKLPRKHSGVPIPEKMRLALLKRAQTGYKWDDSFWLTSKPLLPFFNFFIYPKRYPKDGTIVMSSISDKYFQRYGDKQLTENTDCTEN